MYNSGAKAAESFDALFNRLFVLGSDSRSYSKSQVLEVLEANGVRLENISSILSGSGSKVVEAFDKLFDRLFVVRSDGLYVKSSALEVLESNCIILQDVSGVLNNSGARAAENFDTLFNQLISAGGNRTNIYARLVALRSGTLSI